MSIHIAELPIGFIFNVLTSAILSDTDILLWYFLSKAIDSVAKSETSEITLDIVADDVNFTFFQRFWNVKFVA